MACTTFVRSNLAQNLFATLRLLILLSVSVEAQIGRTTDGVTPPGLAPGAPAGSYPLSDFENINLYNGHVSFSLPITQKGRGGANISIPIRISPKPWTVKHQRLEVPIPHPLPPGTMQDVFNAEPGWWNDTDSRAVLPGGRMIGRYVTEEVVDCSGSLYAMRTNTRLTFTAPDGTEYNLIDKEKGGNPRLDSCGFTVSNYRGSIFITADGTSATFYSQNPIADVIDASDPQWMYASTTFYPSGYLMLRDGTRYDISDGYVTRMRDRNGNEVRYEPIINIGIVGWTITDSLNRQIIINYDVNDGGQYGVVDRITIKGFGGANRYIRISYNFTGNWLRTTQPTDPTTPWNIQQLFPQLDNFEGDPGGPLKVSTIWLPDGRSYKFKYNVYHELARVELPTGGAIEYDYSGGEPGGTSSGVIGEYLVQRYPAGSSVPLIGIYRRLIERRVYTGVSLSTLVGKTTYSKPVVVDPGLSTHSSNLLVEQWDPSSGACLARTKHYFQRSAHYSQLRPDGAGAEDIGEAREKRTDALDTSPSMTELRRVEHVWGNGSFIPNDNFGIPVGINPHIDETKTTLADGNLVSKQTFGYDQYNNPIDVWEHNYGSGAPGTLLRHTHTTYLTTNPFQSNVDYAADSSIHIRSLPTIVSVDNGSGLEMARTWYEYDDYSSYSLQDCPGIVQHDSGYGTSYKRRGNLTKVIQFATITPQAENIYLHNKFDIAGNLVKALDGRGAATDIGYSDTYKFAYPTSRTSPIPDPSGYYAQNSSLVTTTSYDFWTGDIVSTTDANGRTTTAEYNDTLDRLTRIAHPDGGETTYQYGDTIGSLYLRAQTKLNATTWTDNYTYFDGLGRAWRSGHYEAPSSWSVTDTQFDALGRAWRVSNPYLAANLSGAVNPSGTWTTTTFDALSRMLTVTTPDGAVVSTSYNGNQVTVTDQSDKARRSVTDALGRLTQVVEDPSGLNYQTNYTYDALNNLRKVQQGAQERFFAYDSLSRLIRARNVEQGNFTAGTFYWTPPNDEIKSRKPYTDQVTGRSEWSTGYHYDAAGNLFERTDANNRTTRFGYDWINRNTALAYNDGVTPTVERFYDKNPDPAKNCKGRLWYNVVYRYEGANPRFLRTVIDEYDVMGRVKAQRQGFYNGSDWQDYLSTLSYNLTGGPTSEGYPSSRSVTTSYNQSGRISSLSSSGIAGSLVSGISYAAFGGVLSETYGNNLIHAMQYNNRLQVSEIKLGTAGTSDSILKLNYIYGKVNNPNDADGSILTAKNNGNIGRIKYTISGSLKYSQTFQYDGVNRLSYGVEHNNGVLNDPNRAWWQTFAYDAWGNRGINVASTSDNMDLINTALQLSEFSASTNRITRSGYGYDFAGNLSSEPGRSYSYDSENKMITANVSGTITKYAYDADGRRVKKDIGGVVTRFVYNVAGQLIAEYNESGGSLIKEYVYKGGELITTIEPGNVVKYSTADHLGSPRVWTNGSGSVIANGRHDYAPFGEELTAGYGVRGSIGNYPAILQADGQRKQFGSQERDNETGLDFMQARYYSMAHGRFTIPDSFGGKRTNPQTLNLYAYVLNNPLKWTDPTGHFAQDPKKDEDEIENCKCTFEIVTTELGPKPAPVVETPGFFSRIWGGVKGIGSEIGSTAKEIGKGIADIPRHLRNQLRGYHKNPSRFFHDLDYTAGAMGFGGTMGIIGARRGMAKGANLLDDALEESGIVLYHGTRRESAINLLAGEGLDAARAAALKIDGPPGFFLATHADDAAVFAARQGECMRRRAGEWYVIGSDLDWLKHEKYNALDLFNHVVPAPAHGEHSMRGEILVNAFAHDIAVLEDGKVLQVKGEKPPSTTLEKTAGMRQGIIFRL